MDKIQDSVGRAGINHAADVKLIQQLLNAQQIPGIDIPLDVDGKIGGKTIARIEAFQKTIVNMIHPDGRVDPDGKTFNKLLEGATRPGARAASSFSFSQQGVELLKSIEQLATMPYDDQTGQPISFWVEGATIGYGHLINEDEWPEYKHGLTQEQALTLFKTDLRPYVLTVRNQVSASITQNEFDAMVILAFNIGTNGFTGSSALKLVNDPDASTSYPSLEAAWKAWNKSQGVINQGLINRREAEWNIYSQGIYKKW